MKIKVLRIMLRYPERKLSGRELAKFVKEASHQAVANSLKDLIAMNIINVEHHGTSQILTINKESYLFKVLKDLFEREEKTIAKLIFVLKDVPVKTAAIFGSIARKEEKVDSDIDLLLITENKRKVESILDKKRTKIYKLFGNSLVPYVMTEKEFKEKKDTNLVKNILRNYMLVKGEKL